MRLVVVVASLTACFSKPPPPTGLTADGGDDDGAIDGPSSNGDAAVACAHWGLFGTPVRVEVPPIANIGAQHVTMSNDGLELIYDLQGTFYESVRTSSVEVFSTATAVPGFDSLSGDEGAWLTPDRRILFYIDGPTLIETPARATIDDPFLPGLNVFAGVDDATATNDRLRIAYSTNNTLRLLTFESADDLASATDMTLVDDTMSSVADTAPSIGDHGRKLVWTKTNVLQPVDSVLYEADFNGIKLTNAHDLMLDDGSFDTDANLSDDGKTLYFTSTRDTNDPTPQLYVTTRVCN